MKSDIQIRAAKDSDIGAITEIYAHHVLHGTGSFETEPPDADEMSRRMADVVSRGLPYLVAESGNVVVGYAYAGPHRTRLTGARDDQQKQRCERNGGAKRGHVVLHAMNRMRRR